MRQLPIPELVVGLVVAAVALVLRTMWGFSRVSSAGAAETVGQPLAESGGTERKRAQLIASCVLLVVISIPLILRLVPPNGMYGFRVAATQSSPAVWYPANAFMGWALSAAAVISVILLVTLPATVKRWLLWAAFLGPVSGAIAASFVYLNRLG